MNPYNFVPLGPAAPRRKVRTHESYGQSLHAGTLVCRIKTLTEIFVAEPHERAESNQHQELRFVREDGKPIIPGSSLKGSIRSVAEALSGSCLVLAGDRKRRAVSRDTLAYWDQKRPHEYAISDGFAPCGMTDERAGSHGKDRRGKSHEILACPACRMFGFLDRNNVHLGYINFSSAHLNGEAAEFQMQTLAPAGAPGPRHRTFYGTPSTGFRDARGRKFYYHRPQGVQISRDKSDQNKTVETLLPVATFEFKVDYENLSDDELALLIFALILEDPMRHKIGMGKGLGLGSVQITIEEWRTIDLSKRYQQLSAGSQILGGDALTAALQQQREKYHSVFSGWQNSLQALREIWTWDAKQTREVQYPSYMWFKDFSTVPLEEVPDDAGQYKLRQAPQPPRGPSRSGPFTPRPEDVRAAAEAQKETERLLRQAQKRSAQQAALEQMPYRDRDTEEPKILSVSSDTFEVALKNLPGQKFTVKKKNQFRPYRVNSNIRVRILVNRNGEITRVEEV